MTRSPFLPIVLALTACGGGDAPPPAPKADPVDAPSGPARVDVPAPKKPLQGPTRNEALAEVVTDRFIALAQKLQIRDFEGMRAWLTDDFQGEDPWAAVPDDSAARTETLPLGAERVALPEFASGALGRDPFIEAIAGHIGDWRRVTQAQLKLVGVSFEHAAKVEWGRAKLKLHVVGERAEGGFDALVAKGEAKLVNDGGEWRIARLRIDSRERLTHDRTWYAEVSRATGVAYDGPAFGAPGNDTVAWNGAAAGDFDGDGRFDVFVPSGLRSFLYRNTGEGSFDEQAAAAGLGAESLGTGAVFFDFDRDGDQDLAVAHTGWRSLDGQLGGKPLALYENVGGGRFRDVAAERGAAVRHATTTVVVFDADGDGWQDLYLVGFGRMEVEPNDSWIRASNGEPDRLLRNVEGRFVDATDAAGFDDRSWGHGAAAADYDADGDQDLYVANNFGPGQLWRNDGAGRFEDVAATLGVDAPGIVMGATFGDLDFDGRLDLYLANPTSVAGARMLGHLDLDGRDRAAASLRQHPLGNRLFKGDGRGGFVEVAQGHGAASAGWGFGVALSDLDLDGGLDIACVNGFVTGDLTADT